MMMGDQHRVVKIFNSIHRGVEVLLRMGEG